MLNQMESHSHMKVVVWLPKYSILAVKHMIL